MIRNVLSVSVVIPMYNSSGTIVRALKSIFGQTSLPSEIILVDDCSSDDSINIALTWVAAQNKTCIHVNIIRMPSNAGPASARNVGWQAASQSYIAFLDADDSWHPDKLRIQYKHFQTNPEVAILSGLRIFLDDEIDVPPVIPEITNITRISALNLIFKNYFSTSTVMIKRNIPFRFVDNKKYCEDHYLWLQIAFAGLAADLIEAPMAYAYKPLYGASGLSGQLWKMEKGELDNLSRLYNDRKISFIVYICAVVFSVAKYFLRLIKVFFKQNN